VSFFRDLMKQADSDVSKVVDVLQQFRRRALAQCPACKDTGVVLTARGEVPCHCEAGKTLTDPSKRLR
jgi:hypothetical protein